MSDDSPSVRLAFFSNTQVDAALVARPHDTAAPALLVSYVYREPFLKYRAGYRYRDWVMDSGAFSAHHSGTTIPLDAYIETCRELLATDPTLTEVFSLDVIGDHVASRVNCEAMWTAGVPAIPCYHHGEPESVLVDLARHYPKIALGGAVGLKAGYKLRWATQCFARVWPTRIHGFGFGSTMHLMALPWHSVDATNWESGPCMFGNWKRYGRMSVRGSDQNLRAEVQIFLTAEQQARVRWAKQMAELDALPSAPTVRLAMATNRDDSARYTNTLR